VFSFFIGDDLLSVQEDSNAREFLALKKFQGSAASSREMRHAIRYASTLDLLMRNHRRQ